MRIFLHKSLGVLQYLSILPLFSLSFEFFFSHFCCGTDGPSAWQVVKNVEQPHTLTEQTGDANWETCHVTFDHGGKVPYLEGAERAKRETESRKTAQVLMALNQLQ